MQELTCSLDYDAEDRRGEEHRSDPAGEDGDGKTAKSKSKTKLKKRKAARDNAAADRLDNTEVGEEDTPVPKKKRRRGSKDGSKDIISTAGAKKAADGRGRQAPLGAQGSVDWKAVVAEFGV